MTAACRFESLSNGRLRKSSIPGIDDLLIGRGGEPCNWMRFSEFQKK
jgi:hypothetical protein